MREPAFFEEFFDRWALDEVQVGGEGSQVADGIFRVPTAVCDVG